MNANSCGYFGFLTLNLRSLRARWDLHTKFGNDPKHLRFKDNNRRFERWFLIFLIKNGDRTEYSAFET